MGAFVLAWMVGNGIIVYRSVKVNKAPPQPGTLLVSSGVFFLLALLAESPKARSLAITLAWGFDAAAFMNLFGVGKPVEGKGAWPPDLASDTVIFPDGK
jgi:hypothetical protein